MRRIALGLALAVLLAGASCGSRIAAHDAPGAAPVLAYSIITGGRHAGEAEIRIAPDGRRFEHFTYNDRGRGPDLQTELSLDERGAPRWFRATGHDYLKARVDERLDTHGTTLAWRSTSEHGQAAASAGFYVAQNAGIDTQVVLVRALLRAPGHRLELLPAGEAWIEDRTSRDLELGGARRRLERIAIAGLGFEPVPVWLDEHGELFAAVHSWTSVIRRGFEAAIPTLVADDQAWAAARGEKLAARLAHRPPSAGLAITHARLYDPERRAVVPDATVVVVDDRIIAVGDASTPIPGGAQVIDARGRTLLPGLWDMHVHQSDLAGALQLASGITTVRDLGNDLDELTARVARIDAGTELGPRVLRAGLIDGPGPLAAPTGLVAGTPAEAIVAVQRFADAGFAQIKIYSSVPPALVPVIAKAAHARGLRVSGHIPFGMTAADAVEQGFDELQHVNFLFLRFLATPTDDTRTPLRFTRVAEAAAGLDLDGPEVQRFLDLLAAQKTVLDPTLDAFHGMFTADPGELDPVMAPYARRLPAQIERSARLGGLPAGSGQRDGFRASYAALLRMVKLAWDRKIPIVAGTDAVPGLSLSHELELYVQAGIPPADVLALATLGAARVMGQERDSGSIAVGKRADLVLVDGDPTRDITALRNTDAVVCRGVLYDPAELFEAVGMRPR